MGDAQITTLSAAALVQQPYLSIVIPTYGRAKTLEAHIAAVHAHVVKDFPGQLFEIIVVNDASPDPSSSVLESLTARFPTVQALNLAQNQGQQAATCSGLNLAQGSVVVTMDDDGKDDPADVVRLVDLLSSGYDVVYGVPGQASGLTWHRRLGTAVKEALLGCLCNKPAGIRLTSFRAMNRPIVDRVVADTRRHIYISATILEKPVRIGQVRVAVPARNVSGYSLMTLTRLWFRIALWYGPLYRLLKWLDVLARNHSAGQVHSATRVRPEIQS